MRTTVIRSLLATAVIASASGFLCADAAAEAPIGVLVLREHGVGSAAQAQPYVDKFVNVAAKQNGWSGAKGEYHTNRGNAEAFISGQKPHYGILSLGAFLGLKAKHSLEVIGQVAVSRSGGQQYHLIILPVVSSAPRPRTWQRPNLRDWSGGCGHRRRGGCGPWGAGRARRAGREATCSNANRRVAT